jgi:hypothetical protein
MDPIILFAFKQAFLYLFFSLWVIEEFIPIYFPMQKLEKIRPKRSSELNSPVISHSD